MALKPSKKSPLYAPTRGRTDTVSSEIYGPCKIRDHACVMGHGFRASGRMFPFSSRNNHEIHAMSHVIKSLITIESLRLFYDYRVHQYRKIVWMKTTDFYYRLYR